jgi:hypothetical protein
MNETQGVTVKYKKSKFFHNNPPKLKIEDCKLNIFGCRYAPSFYFNR